MFDIYLHVHQGTHTGSEVCGLSGREGGLTDSGRNVASRPGRGGGEVSVTLMVTYAVGERVPGTHYIEDGE